MTGSFQSPGWPVYYPELDFSCQWIINLTDYNDYILRFDTDDTSYGILGRSCPADYLVFFDGLTTASMSLGKYCYVDAPPDILTSSGQALVVFQASTRPHHSSRTGARVSYEAIRLGI